MIKTKNIICLVNNKINFATTFTTPRSWIITYFYFFTATTTTTTTTASTTPWFWQKKYYFDFRHFIFLLPNSRLLLPSTNASTFHDQDNSFFVSLLRSYVMIKRKIISLVTTSTTPRPYRKKFFFHYSLRSLRHDWEENLFFHFGITLNTPLLQKKKFDFYWNTTSTTLRLWKKFSSFISLGRSL